MPWWDRIGDGPNAGHNWRFPGADYSEHRNPEPKKKPKKKVDKLD